MKKIIISILLLIPIISFGQDTIRIDKVPVQKVLVNKYGRVTKKYPKHIIKVKAGYIVNLGNGIYEINGKEMKGEFDSLIAKK